MSAIKECFVPRNTKGCFLQFDYKQLEVVGLAFLSGDSNLRDDIINGVDLHLRALSFMTGEKYEDLYTAYHTGDAGVALGRKDAKALSFLVQYGGTAWTLRSQTGLPLTSCQDFINNYYSTYAGVKRLHDNWVDEARIHGYSDVRKHQDGAPLGLYYMKSVTGRRYCFTEQDHMGKRSFSPTQLKNYPVQGLATGDIVPLMAGQLARKLAIDYNGEVLLVNTVHDSFLLELAKSDPTYTYEVGMDVKRFLEMAPQIASRAFSIDFDLPLHVDVEIGRNWGEMKPLSLTSDE